MRFHCCPVRVFARLCWLAPLLASAQVQTPLPEPESWNLKLQATYVWQTKPSFSAAYSGPNSLSANREKSYSFTSTAYLGLRLGRDTELYLNPELVQGVPLSNLTGLGGLTNGELQKTAGSNPKLYRARLFARHTWGLGGEREAVASEQNQLAGDRDQRRVVVSVGNLAVSDLFDANAYAHDARTQFMNWSFLTHGSYDFAADARGYSWGLATEYFGEGWAVRAGRFIQPLQSNGLALDHAIARHYGDQVELEKGYTIAGQPGKLRLLAFRNVVVMGNFNDALAYAAANGTVPAVAPVRRRQSKVGWGINVEQALGADVGAFARWGRNDGKAEAYAFAEIDRSASAGIVWRGSAWGRSQDTLGVAYARNGLSPEHRQYLAAGGTGFFVGDGALRYGAESIAEAYYAIGFDLGALKRSTATIGVQHIRNPAYNRDRGPVQVISARLHTEF